MSNQSPLGGRGRNMHPTLPKGDVVATYETYPEAQKAVDRLAKADFPVSSLSIIGSDLKTVERVTGKLSWGRVALAGAATGAWMGLFFGLLLAIFSPVANLGVVIAALLIGAGFGMLFGVVSYALTRRRRDYTSVMQVLAASYSIIVEPSLVGRARNLLQDSDDRWQAHEEARPPAHPSDPPPVWRPPEGNPPDEPSGGEPQKPEEPREPPRYGERREEDPPEPQEPPRYGERRED